MQNPGDVELGEIEKKHEKSRQKEHDTPSSLSDKLNDYSSNFTIHGLSRTIHSDKLLERSFWIVALLIALFGAGFMVRSIFIKFITKSVYSKSSLHIDSKMKFPAVTLCLLNTYSQLDYCYLYAADPPPAIPYDHYCKSKDSFMKFLNKAEFRTVGGAHSVFTTTFGTFEIDCSNINRGACLNSYITPEYLDVSPEDPQNCVTWNQKGNFHNFKSEIELHVSIKFLHYEIFVHDPMVSPFYGRKIGASSDQNIELAFEKIVEKRLNRAYPNDCVVNVNNNSKNIFPGKYSQEACQDSYTCLEALKKCGQTLDVCNPYIPNDVMDKYFKNETQRAVHKCLYLGFLQDKFTPSPKKCPLSCERVVYRFSSSTSNTGISPGKTNSFKLKMSYADRNTYETREEKFSYTWEDLVAGVGGSIGLFCGFSILSIVELFVYLYLRCSVKGREKAASYKNRQNEAENETIENEHFK